MFPQTKYEYDLLLLRVMQNDSLYFIYPFILISHVLYTIKMYTLSLIYLERGLYFDNKLFSPLDIYSYKCTLILYSNI